MKEVYKWIYNYVGKYKISNNGNIISVKRLDNKGRVVHPRNMKLTIDKTGYKTVCLYSNGKGKKFNVHQLVAISFLNHHPDGFNKVVDHIDENPLNNNANNLQIISSRENISKAYRNKQTSSKYTGVTKTKYNKFRAIICINKKNINIGTFEKEVDAHKAYQKQLKISINNELSILKRE